MLEKFTLCNFTYFNFFQVFFPSNVYIIDKCINSNVVMNAFKIFLTSFYSGISERNLLKEECFFSLNEKVINLNVITN